MLLTELVNEAIDCLFHFGRGFSRHHPLILEHFQSTNTTGLVHHGTPRIDDIIDNVVGTGNLFMTSGVQLKAMREWHMVAVIFLAFAILQMRLTTGLLLDLPFSGAS